LTRPPSEAVDLTHLILHLDEHLLDRGLSEAARDWGADHEQTQTINTAKGRATQREVPIVDTSAENKSVSNSRPDMTHSREPPRAMLVAQRMNDQKAGD
jgi:hypothetical protein